MEVTSIDKHHDFFEHWMDSWHYESSWNWKEKFDQDLILDSKSIWKGFAFIGGQLYIIFILRDD